MRRGYQIAKRTIDVVVSAAALVLTAPVQAGVAVAVARKLGRPVLFRQQRPGKEGKPFTLLKFRTMLPIDKAKGLISDEDRLTRFGQLLRATSLDELPSLVNVLRGDMSLVGPRPLRMHYLPLYNERQARRHEVRPGITGLAQVKGRNLLTWEERFNLDVEYVENCTFRHDFEIIMRTLGSVARRTGISAEGQATMTPFVGTTAGE